MRPPGSENYSIGETDLQARQQVRRQVVEDREQSIQNINHTTEDMRMPILLPRPPIVRQSEWEGRTRLASNNRGRTNDGTGEEEEEPPLRLRRF